MIEAEATRRVEEEGRKERGREGGREEGREKNRGNRTDRDCTTLGASLIVHYKYAHTCSRCSHDKDVSSGSLPMS